MNNQLIEYRGVIDQGIKKAYDVANLARRKGFDPEEEVEIPLAKNMAERVEGLLSVVAPQVKGTRIALRINELEKSFAGQDWRVAFILALEVAKEKFCGFKDKKEAIEVGMRAGLAYITNGVVASPLEGFTRLAIKKRRDGGEYFSLYFAGPIRSAGTTAICVFVALADYLRKEFGYKEYDPSEIEIKRIVTELYDFHEKVTNLQYLPSEEELEFMVKSLPLQIDGEATEKYEVSNYKDLDRIETNVLRNGVALVLGEGLTQKSKKFWGKFSKWCKEFGMEHWAFLEEFVKLQERIRAKEKKEKTETKEKLKPDYGFIKDLVAGRPVLTHPLAKGGFRLRYGRCRNSGFSSQAIHPATMVIVNDFLAIGTQLKVERPGKATTLASCDSIEGPIVKLNNGGVVWVDNIEEAKKVVNDVDEILYLGDVLINYGDFFNRGHVLVPPGYCEDWWMLESGSSKKEASIEEAIEFCKNGKPLHPRYCFHWKEIDRKKFDLLINWLKKGSINEDKIILPYEYNIERELKNEDPKRALELLGIPHLAKGESVVIEYPWCRALMFSLGHDLDKIKTDKEDVLEIVNEFSGVIIRDKSGTTIGARMGRPEKAKMRKLTGSPQVLFPVGNEGGRMRCFQSALEKGKITADFPLFYCPKCKREVIFSVCHVCGDKTNRRYYSKTLGLIDDFGLDKSSLGYKKLEINIGEYFDSALKILKTRHYPELIKGVRGTSNQEHITEHLVKGILRASYGLYVNKDGTVRYDMTETTITHFKPKEIGTPIDKLKELGYEKDIYGKELTSDEQILEIQVQDIILPSCDKTLDEKADDVLFNVARFVDELLVKLYGLDKFYDLKSKKDLVGQLVIGMSPHTSAGVVGRIIGFSNTQGFYCHPFFHSLMRRDCVYPSTKLFFYDDESKQVFYDGIGKYVENLISSGSKLKRLDAYGTLSVECKKNLFTLGIDPYTHELKKKRIKYFIKGPETKEWIKIITATNREYTMTPTHKFMYVEDNEFKFKEARDVKENDALPILENFNFYTEKKEIDLIKLFKEKLSEKEQKEILVIKEKKQIELSVFSDPDYQTLRLRHKFSKHEFPTILNITPEFMRILGYYTAEGYSRTNKTVSQVAFRICDREMQEHLISLIKKTFSLNPNLGEDNTKITICSKLIYYLFIAIGVGKTAYEKRVPNFIFGLDKNLVKEYISTYFEGDGSVIKSKKVIVFYSVSRSLLDDISLLLTKFHIISRYFRTSLRMPGKKVLEKYQKLGKQPKQHILNHLVLGVYDSYKLKSILSPVGNKFLDLEYLKPAENRYINFNKKQIILEAQSDYLIDYVKKVEIIKDTKNSYCVEIDWKKLGDRNVLWGEQVINTRCDGDEACVILLMDALLNFSRKYIPGHRGAKQDEPLVLSSYLIPSEVDDMVFDMDIVDKYPLELYQAAMEYKYPWDVKIKTVKNVLGTDEETSGFMFTHDTSNINLGVVCSSYKSIPTMLEKVEGQMRIAEKIRAVDENDVARLVIERHFIRDIKGNLRKFGMQQFRCVDCNEKYRRPPLAGYCKCGGKLIFTISEGSIVKYLELSLFLAERYNLPAYLKQTLALTKQRIESVFGKDKEKQEGLIKWFGKK